MFKFQSSNLIDEPIFSYNKNPTNLIIELLTNLVLLAEQKKLEIRKTVQDIEVAARERMKKVLKLKKCGSVTGGKDSKPMTRAKITSEPTFPIKDLFLQSPFGKNKRWISFRFCLVQFSCSR